MAQAERYLVDQCGTGTELETTKESVARAATISGKGEGRNKQSGLSDPERNQRS